MVAAPAVIHSSRLVRGSGATMVGWWGDAGLPVIGAIWGDSDGPALLATRPMIPRFRGAAAVHEPR